MSAFGVSSASTSVEQDTARRRSLSDSVCSLSPPCERALPDDASSDASLGESLLAASPAKSQSSTNITLQAQVVSDDGGESTASVDSTGAAESARHVPFSSCEMCANYEQRLQQLQELERDLVHKLTAAQHSSDRYHAELSTERQMRADLESSMLQLSTDAQKEAAKAEASTSVLEEAIRSVQSGFESQLNESASELDRLREERASAQRHVDKVRRQYEALLGRQRQEAEAMQSEAIAFPESVDELQLLCLGLREELIEARAARRHMEESLEGEAASVRDQLTAEQTDRERVEASLMDEVNGLRTQLGLSESHACEMDAAAERAETAERRLAEFQSTVSDLETRLGALQTERGELEFSLQETRRRCTTLQRELDNSEAVQRDFVKLSQSLQIELEKIRQAEQEVRWQFDEDAFDCNVCKQAFSRARLKLHCRHCGKVFCDDCLPKTVPSGPQRRPARVCQVCHTLLVRDTAPYFSESVPPT